MCLAGGVSAQTDMNKLLASAPLETVRYVYASGVFGINIKNVETMQKRESGDDYIYTATVEFDDGFVRITAIVDKKTMRQKRGIAEEFGKVVEYEIENGTVTGTERNGKKVKNFSVAANGGGDVHDSRAYSFALYDLLPLDDNFSRTLKIFDPKKKQIRDIQFKVVGSETVEIGRSRFDCYTVEASANEDGTGKYTAWIDKRTRRIIRLKGYGGYARMFGAEAEILLPEKRH